MDLQKTLLPTIPLLSQDVTADVVVTCYSVACKHGCGHAAWWPWKCAYRAIALQWPSPLASQFHLSADMPQEYNSFTLKSLLVVFHLIAILIIYSLFNVI
jgi:hypothetical protein